MSLGPSIGNAFDDEQEEWDDDLNRTKRKLATAREIIAELEAELCACDEPIICTAHRTGILATVAEMKKRSGL